MIVVDTSVLVAIVRQESDEDAYTRHLTSGEATAVPASCYLEAVMVLSSEAGGRRRLDDVLARFGMTTIPIEADEARLAADAFERYGRGSGSPARLNFGDCLAYAAAAARRAPLLFKGDDFARTDVRRVG